MMTELIFHYHFLLQMLKNRKGATGHGNSLSAKTFDTAALKRYAAWGFFVIPPIYSKWYQWLDKAFKTSVGSHSLKVMGQKLFLDQVRICCRLT